MKDSRRLSKRIENIKILPLHKREDGTCRFLRNKQNDDYIRNHEYQKSLVEKTLISTYNGHEEGKIGSSKKRDNIFTRSLKSKTQKTHQRDSYEE
jgi:hypothetical protein